MSPREQAALLHAADAAVRQRRTGDAITEAVSVLVADETLEVLAAVAGRKFGSVALSLFGKCSTPADVSAVIREAAGVVSPR